MQISYSNIIQNSNSDIKLVNELENRLFMFVNNEKDCLDENENLDDIKIV